MNKFWKILKVSLRDDFNLFKINSDDIKGPRKVLLLLFLTLAIFYSIGYYSYLLAEPLHGMGLTYILLSIWMMGISVLTLFEGIYKSQGILYDAKDNDLLMSLPINKSTILFVRIVKLILFQILYNLIFMLPAIGVYIYFENPSISFYLITFVMLILLPIIPTCISSFIGSLIKGIVGNFKNKKLLQTFLTIVMIIAVMIGSFYIQNKGDSLLNQASNINNMVSLYYPIKLYLNLIFNFNIVDFIKLIGINFFVLFLFIYIIKFNYFKIILKNKETSVKSKKKYKEIVRAPFWALVFKEFKSFINSPIYILNTLFGLLFILGLTVVLIIKPDVIGLISGPEISGEDINNNFSLIYMGVLIFTLSITNITCSSISLEGKYFDLLKSLPVDFKDIVLAKLTTSLLIIYPFIFISDALLFIKFNFDILSIIFVLLISFILPILINLIGLMINLRHPKLHFKNDTEVIKQSMSVMISIYVGMGIGVLLMAIYTYLVDKINSNVVILGEIILIILVSFILYNILMKNGKRLFSNINF